MSTFLTVLGIFVVGAAAHDVFHTLFHPSRSGAISNRIAEQTWRVFRHSFRGALSFAGPMAFASTIFYWVFSILVGFALMYLPHLPNAFTFNSELDPSRYSSFLGAFDISLGALITLSTGAYSKEPSILLMMGIESIFGFGLLTASVSWLLSIYPVFEHRKSLAHAAALLHFAEAQGGHRLANLSDSELQEILLGLVSQLITNRNELMQFPITYYFHEEEEQSALAGILPYVADIAEEHAERNGGAGIAATALGGAVHDYLKLIAERFLKREFTSREDILLAFAQDHMRSIVRSVQPVPKAA